MLKTFLFIRTNFHTTENEGPNLQKNLKICPKVS